MSLKSLFLRAALCAALFAPLLKAARAAEPVTPSAAHLAQWDSALQDIYKTLETREGGKKGPQPKPLDVVLFNDRNARKRSEGALAFYRTHPSSPMRWEAARMFVAVHPQFITGVKPEYEKNPAPENFVVDEAARAQWEKTSTELQIAMEQATDIPMTIPQREEQSALGAAGFDAKTKAEFLALGERVKAHATKYAQIPQAARTVSDFVASATDANVLTPLEAWQMFADSVHPGVQQMARENVARLAFLAKPLEISFVAADGRKVDLQDLRGKVVLVDFWATWCGPCKAEIPNVVANYKKYHDKGFEVVGISLENGRLTPGDTPEKTETKLAAAKKTLMDFVAVHDMPWPQYFDGQFWENPLAKKCVVGSIPAMFLVDQNGMVVSTKARGAKLEAEIKRLLKL